MTVPVTSPTDCPVCPTTPGHGWRQQGVTHCHTCHATWNLGTRTAHCATCHATFSAPSNFDLHCQGTKTDPGWHCRRPIDVGQVATENPHGTIVWHTPDTSNRWETA